MKIRKGDNVIVISGKDKGKKGKVARNFPSLNKVIVEGVNVHKKNEKARKSDQKGQIVEKPMPINVSNIAIFDSKKNKPTRIGYGEDKGKKVRIAKKSGVKI